MKKLLQLSVCLFAFGFNSWSQPGTVCWREISAGQNFSLAIKSDGTLWGWGQNSNQLGLGFTGNQSAPIQIGTANNWLTVSAGANHSLAVKMNGTLWSWGNGQFGHLGNGLFNSATWNVTQVGTATDWSSVSAGTVFSLALKTNGTLWSWGRNDTGQLGNNTTVDLNIPTQVGTATDWMLIDAGEQHSLAIKTNNSMWAWGANGFGQLGNGNNTTSLVPIQVTAALTWIAISAGGGHSMAINNLNSLWTWGKNLNGQLGDGTILDSNLPLYIQINAAGAVSTVLKISAGQSHSMIILNDNTLWTSGLNLAGQLGLANNTNTNTFNIVGLQNTWDKISAGHQHSLALEFTSNLWSTGRNMEGQLGIGNTIASNILMLVACPNSSSASIHENKLYRWNLEAFPNPCNGIVNLKFNTEISEKIKLSLYDLQGNQLQSVIEDMVTGENYKTINLSNEASGIYFLVAEGNGYKETIRLAKN